MNLPLTLLNRRRRLFGTAADLYGVAGFNPGLVFDFDDEYYRTGGSSSTFSSAITHSRAGNATMVDSDGRLKWAPHNLLTWSEDFSNPAYTKSNIILTSSEVDPLGGSNAAGIRATAQGGFILANVAGTTGVNYTHSFFAASDGALRWLRLVLNSGSCWVDVLNGVGGTVSAGISVNVTPFANNFYLFQVSYTAATTGQTLYIFPVIADNSSTSDLVNTAYIWGAHLYRSDLGGMVSVPEDARATPSATTYVPTTSSARYLARRGHHIWNGTAWVNEGMLHESEARTNLIIQSNDFSAATGAWTLGSVTTTKNAVGPEGSSNSATTLEASSATTNSQINETVSVATSTVYTFSCFAKAGTAEFFSFALAGFTTPAGVPRAYFNVSSGTLGTIDAGFNGGATIENFGNGWYRCSVSFTTDLSDTGGQVYLVVSDADADSSASDGANVLIYGAQFEAGPTPSSYIPNAGTSGGVTRAADLLTVPSANLPYSATAMSIQMQGRATGNTYTTTRWYLDANNYITQEINSSDFTFEQAASGTVDAVTGGSFTSGINTPFNFASTHASTLVAAAVGGTALTDNTTPVALPNLSATDLNLGHSFMGTLKLMRVWSADITEAGREEAST